MGRLAVLGMAALLAVHIPAVVGSPEEDIPAVEGNPREGSPAEGHHTLPALLGYVRVTWHDDGLGLSFRF